MYIKVLLTVFVSLAATGCTIAGMDKIPHYEIIALAVGIAACFVMALGFAITEKFHKQHIEEGTPRWRTWMFFSVVMVVFIFMLTCACTVAEGKVDWEEHRASVAKRAIDEWTYFVYQKETGICFAVTFEGKGNAITATTTVPCLLVEKHLVNKEDYTRDHYLYGKEVHDEPQIR